jgi:hypothetical protein
MKKILLILFFLLLFSKIASSQYRIVLDKSNTYPFGYLYLIDVPFSKNIKNLYIDNSNNIVPTDVLLAAKNGVWYWVDTLIVLEKINPQKNNILNNEEFSEYIIPSKGAKIESTGISKKFENYKDIRPTGTNGPDSVLIYYSEPNESAFGHEGSQKILTLAESIKTFEEDYKIKIGDTYYKKTGDGDEKVIYCTLNGLTPAQKFDFIEMRFWDKMPDKEVQKIRRSMVIHMPFLVSKKNLVMYK